MVNSALSNEDIIYQETTFNK